MAELAYGFAPWALDAAVKVLLILTLALLAHWILRRASAALRHILLVTTVAILLVLPPVSLLIPQWHLGMVSLPALVEGGSQPGGQPLEFTEGGERGITTAGQKSDLGAGGKRPEAIGADYLAWAFWIWLVGAAALLLWLVGGRLYGQWTVRNSFEYEEDWLLEMVEQAAKKLGYGGRLTVVGSRDVEVPVIHGALRPKLILPERYIAWPRERLESIILHEIAHIKRYDILTQSLAQLLCILHWFNPLAWITSRKQMVERERACDDMVVGLGVKSSDYATHLMDTAKELGSRRNPSWALVAMAEGTDFKDRVLGVLDPGVNRRPVRKGMKVMMAAIVALICIPAAALSPWSAVPAERQDVSVSKEGFIHYEPVLNLEEADRYTFEQIFGEISGIYEDLKSIAGEVREGMDSARAIEAVDAEFSPMDERVGALADQAMMKFVRTPTSDTLREFFTDFFKVVRAAFLNSLDRVTQPSARQELVEAEIELVTRVKEMSASRFNRLEGRHPDSAVDQVMMFAYAELNNFCIGLLDEIRAKAGE
jgi:beta-lactamase regulating signal transducer with metallopeptidase domain